MRWFVLVISGLLANLYAQESAMDTVFSEGEKDSIFLLERINLVLDLYDSDLDSADELAELVFNDETTKESDYLLSEIFDAKSLILKEQGFWKLAMNYQDSALRIRRGYNWMKAIGKSYNHLGMIQYQEGEFLERSGKDDEAMSCYRNTMVSFEKAYSYYKQAEDTLEMANAIHNIAMTHYLLFEDSTAMKRFRESLVLYNLTEDGENQLSGVWNNMALIFDNWQMRDSTEYYYLAAIELDKKLNHHIGLIGMYSNLANFHEDEPDIAIAYLEKADSICVATGNTVKRALVQEYLYNVKLSIQNYEEALEHFVLYTQIKDDMLTRDYKTEELNVRYETAMQKEQIANQRATNLSQQLELQKVGAQRQRLQILAGFFGILFLGALGWYFWRRKVMKQIAAHEEAIHQQKLIELEQAKNLETARAMLTGQEKERIRIAEDLHDRLGSTLSAAKMQMEVAASRTEEDNKYLTKSKSLIDKAIGDTREISHNMISGVLVKLGLNAAIEDLKESLQVTNKLDFKLELDEIPNLSMQQQLQVFRIIQELVNNSVKHAEADEISIELVKNGKGFHFKVADNGKGFDKDVVQKGLGLSNVARRVETLEGEMHLHSDENGSVFNISVGEYG